VQGITLGSDATTSAGPLDGEVAVVVVVVDLVVVVVD
jgi:hypothetical protein